MSIDDLKYYDFRVRDIAIAAGIVAVILMSAGLFTAFFSRLIIIIATLGGVVIAGKTALDSYKNKQVQQPMNSASLLRPEIKPVIINLVEDSGKIPDPTVLLKHMGIDKLQPPVNPGYADQIQQSCTDQKPGLLKAVINLDCLMIWGGRGAGKTNFIQHLAREKVRSGEDLWIIDPKPSKPGKWPEGVNVIGQSHNYQEIMEIGEKYDFELQCRKAQFHDVQNFPKVTLIVDELYLLNMKIKGFMDMILPLLLEGREYNIHMMLISQSKTAGSLGLKGRYDLLECFDAVVGLERNGPKHDSRSYLAVVDFGRGDIDHRPPGAYRPDRSANHNNMSQSQYRTQMNPGYGQDTHPDTRDIPTLDFDPDNEEYVYQQQRFYDSRMEKVVVELYVNNPGISYNAICNHIWGASNGRRINQIKEILIKHNCLR